MWKVKNTDYVLKIIKLANEWNVYWHMDQSEDNNGEVRVGFYGIGYSEYFRKRVYDYKDCYEEILEHLKECEKAAKKIRSAR